MYCRYNRCSLELLVCFDFQLVVGYLKSLNRLEDFLLDDDLIQLLIQLDDDLNSTGLHRLVVLALVVSLLKLAS